jgi:hypothetical protein
MTEEAAPFDPGPEFRDDVQRAQALVDALNPEQAKALLRKLVEEIPTLVLPADQRSSSLFAYRPTTRPAPW